MGFRVAADELPDHIQRRIATRVVREDQTSSATLVNLSLSGMLIADLTLELDIGDTVTATIEFGGRAVTLRGAIVRTVADGAVGIHFPDSIQHGEFDPPNALADIHRSLERAWLQHRKK